LKKYSVTNLCKALTRDGLSPDTLATPNTIEWLNDILFVSDLYEKVISIKCDMKPSKRLKALRKKYMGTKNKSNLRKLNRILIEEFYPDMTPKMPLKANGLTEEEAAELSDQIEITLHCGPRKSELLNIRVGDVNFETRMLRLFGKGQKTRFVPMNRRAHEILQRRVKARCNSPSSYIFGDGKTAPKDFKNSFKSSCKNAGLENCRPHDLRRTFGTRCAMAGVPPKTLQKWLGHEHIETTMKYYVQISVEFEQEAIERLLDFRKNDSQGDSSSKKGLSE